jgi:hypothetical protein
MKKNMSNIFGLFYNSFVTINYMPRLASVHSSWRKFLFLDMSFQAEGIAVDPSKVQEVLEWKSPRLVTQIYSFLGLAGYYHWFILNFSKIAKLMTKLLEKDAKFKWSP